MSVSLAGTQVRPNMASNVAQMQGRSGNSAQDQYQTGWWSRITGGATEKASAIAMSNVDRKFQAEQAKLNRQFQERLSSSAYQRAMKDMQKAGLNPALMYKGMSGASTPGGATASGSRTTPPASSTGQLVSLLASAIFAGAKIATSASAVGASSAVSGTKAGIVAKATATPAQAKMVEALYKKMPTGYR